MQRALYSIAFTALFALAWTFPNDAIAQQDPGADQPAPQQQDEDTPEPRYRIPGTPPEPDRTGRASALSERTFNRLTAIHEQIGNEEYEAALSRLLDLIPAARNNPYEQALMTRDAGFVLAQLERYDEAVQRFERALEIDALGHTETQQMFLFVAQVRAMQDRWADSRRMMTRYFYWEEAPTPDALMLMATTYAHDDQHRPALTWINRAIAASRTPRESWYQLRLAMQYELGEYSDAADTLAMLIAHWPDNLVYWEQLASMLMTHLNREADALAILSMAYRRGLMEDGDKILNLARFYMYRGAPYTAARLVRDGLSDGHIEGTRGNWELLSQAFQMAQESDDAINALQRAAALSDDGELFVREAQLHAAVDNWEGVQRAATEAVRKGGLRNPGSVHMLMGIAAYERDQYQEALRAFRAAAQHSNTRTNANQWVQYINNELRTQRELREGI